MQLPMQYLISFNELSVSKYFLIGGLFFNAC